MPAWYVYILRCSDGSLYTGISNDVVARIKKHNAGTGAAYTRSHRPVVLTWKKRCISKSRALKYEAEIKHWTKERKELFIKQQLD